MTPSKAPEARMRCPRCGAHSPAGKKFCGDCGAALAVACPSCGAANSTGEDFCSRCGAVLDAPGFVEAGEPSGAAGIGGRLGEIKQVTVLFCDIVGSTALTERLGAEAMRDLVGAFIDASLAEVHRYGGTAPQFRGDGFMALFGAPLAQEDHVRRALLAALAIQRAVPDETEWDGHHKLDLQIRIGIHTGSVVYGRVSQGFREETAIGDTANVAARLEEAAEPGGILVSEAVRSLAQNYARFEAAGLLNLKGKREPVAGYRLLGVSRWRAARDAVSPPRMPSFIGRDRELALLENTLLEVENGGGRVVGIAGDPGIGKSRLLAEFRRRSADRVNWVEGQCLSYGGGIPYWLALDLLRSHCGIVETDTTEAIAEKVRAGLQAVGIDADQDSPVLLHILGIKDAAGVPALSNPEAIKAKSFEVFQRLCLEGSRRGPPLVLALEDLHWIDTVSEELLGALVKQVRGARILLLASYRPEYWPPWAGNLDIAEIPLQPLSRDDSLQIVHSVLQGDEIATPLAEQIVSRAGGNPLFLEQLALHAGEANDTRSDLTVPQTIHGVVMARIDRLPEATKQLLQTAAVIGREFSLRLLRAVWRSRGPPETQLRELSRLEFLDEWPDDEGTTYTFRHALTQEAAYGSLLERDRRRGHADIGGALEALYSGRTDEVAELLAFHFSRSDDAERAVDYAIAAAVKAGRGWANSEALNFFNDALGRLDTMPESYTNRLRRVDAVLKQAEVKYALGQCDQQIQALEGIRQVVNETGDPRLRATWSYWTGFLHTVSGDRPEIAIEHCRKAATIASNAQLEGIDGFAESCLAQAYMVAGRLNEALEAGERALSSFEARGDRWWAGRTLWHLTSIANYLGEWDRSLNFCTRGLQHGIVLNDLRLKVVGWSRMGVAHIVRGDIERGLQCCNEALALAPIPRDAAFASVVRGYGKIKAGLVETGIGELREALTWFQSSEMRFTHVVFATWLAEGYLRHNDLINARMIVDHILAMSRSAGYLHYEGRGCWLMAECLAEEAAGSAEDHVESAMRIFRQVGARNDLARAMVTSAALRQRAGHITAARELLNHADATFRTLGTLDEPARVSAALAALDQDSPIRLLGR
jgi:class 3 adenylate cyclase/tetratricopeptide (TPR) repeat protein